MSLLTLKGVGKIYVSDGNVAVGIRGVNLSFDRGEFVAVTGKSGSGKSTLLSVISGMDTYEEGDLLIEGRSTAHYTQPDWEEYRQKYISFIFQDYNIIESFTVLQNVELALMHITDRRQRRARALELIRRVGLSGHLRQKGSKLSGGQKQRTVIARALAKDSPIILADEPTGNLDSATGKEIVELLREVSKEKLVIVVTHNFEQVEYCATRHIRIFDGAVESDHVITKPQPPQEPAKPAENASKSLSAWQGGRVLGRSMFASRPKLTTFMCLLMAVGMLGLFFATSMFQGMNDLFEKHYMFRHINGRLVLTRQNGAVMTDDEVAALAKQYGANTYLHYDKLIDQGSAYLYSNKTHTAARLYYTYGELVNGTVYGRYPTARDEVLLYLPIHLKPDYGTDPENSGKTYSEDGITFRVVGVAYYYDNTQPGRAVFSEAGYQTILGVYSLIMEASTEAYVVLKNGDKAELAVYVNFAVESGKYVLTGPNIIGEEASDISVTSRYYGYNYEDSDVGKENLRTWTLSAAQRSQTTLGVNAVDPYANCLVLSPELACQLATEYLSLSYRQASLFFDDDKAAHDAATQLNANGYLAVPSNTVYSPDPSELVLSTLLAVFTLCEWLLVVLFLAFFINLCSSRTIGTFRGDLAVMRSMGIPVKVIRVGMYVRMLLTLIPAYILLAVCAALIYLSPKANAIFPFLHGWQYLFLCVGLLLVTLRVTHKQIHKLFHQSVKKALRGGNAE